MRTPWFMHAPRGQNTLFGVYPTNVGTFVRSCQGGEVEVTWYPMGCEFPDGDTRQATRIVVPSRIEEDEIDQRVEDFMHGHPVLCMVHHRRTANTDHSWIATREIDTARQSRIDVLSVEDGDYVRTHRQGFVTVRYVPAGRGDEVEVCRVSDKCGDDIALARADDRVSRYMTAVSHYASLSKAA